MKTIGLIGGMSWESTVEYYRIINELVNQKLGGYHSAKIVLVSVDFEEIEQYQRNDQWEKAGIVLAKAAKQLEQAGVDLILLCTNTMHKVQEEIEKSISVPFYHIADGTAEEIIQNGIKTIGLLGTKYTMEQDFYIGRLEEKYGLNVVVPDKEDREIVNKIIFDELVHGEINESSRNQYQRIISNLVEKGVGGIILGCTEIALLVKQEDATVPLFDTTYIHAKNAVDKAIEK